MKAAARYEGGAGAIPASLPESDPAQKPARFAKEVDAVNQ